MSDKLTPACGCSEFEHTQERLSRRGFLGGVLALGGGVLLGTGTGFEYALAAEGSNPADVIINLNMRGGMDGLLAVPVLGSAALRAARPDLVLPDSSNLRLDSTFGLHPNLKGFKDLFDSKELSIVHAVGVPTGSRSHFDEQLAIELAAYDNGATVSGWQSRLLKNTGSDQVFEGVAMATSMPASLGGSSNAVAFQSLTDVKLNEVGIDRQAQLNLLKKLHADKNHVWSATADTSLAAAIQLESVNEATAVLYPAGKLGERFKLLAAMMKSGLPIKTVNIDFDGHLDVHVEAGAQTGTMADNFTRLSGAITAFKKDLGAYWQKVTIVTVTEFGRRVEQNAQEGLDHGWASAMFVINGAGKAGSIHAKWPGVEENDLVDGDLKVTTDYRDVLAEVLTKRAGVSASAISNILPGFKPQALGILSN